VTRRFLIVLAAIALILVVGITALLPPRALASAQPSFSLTWPVVRGAYHVHSVRSDGTGSVDEIAAAAARAGLQFVILTDHGDGTRPPDPPSYRSGVLCIDGVEISTDAGHYVAIGLPQTPYPLAGSAREVVEDVRRFGGIGIAAHPDSTKEQLRWRDWTLPVDGLEWLNADSEWRDELWASLGAMLLTYPFRPVETLAGLLDRPGSVLSRWDDLTRRRRVVALAGADAHARLGFRQSTDPYEDYVVARVPGYEDSFRAFLNHVILTSPLTGDATSDARLIIDALQEGHAFASVEGLAQLGGFEAKATSGSAAAIPGAYLDITAPVAIEAAIAAPAGTRMIVMRDGEMLYETREAALRIDVGTQPGVYRLEAYLPGQNGAHNVPWLLTNPFYVGLRDRHASAAFEPTGSGATTRSAIATEAWTAEASEGSHSELRTGALEDGTPALDWSFRLAAGDRVSQYAAMRFPVSGGLTAHDRLQLRARADRPMRIWAQVRTSAQAGGERWGRTFYVDEQLASIELPFSEFRPLDSSGSSSLPLDRIDSLLLVIDTLNATPGSGGRVQIAELWFAR
jgi:hypothetical protein